jgi:putative SOS response-associated peptidase YedK
MCGRFVLHTPPSLIAARYFDHDLADTGFQESFNIAPGRPITAVRSGNGNAARFVATHWGFRPAWARDDAPVPINIRAEKAATSPYFRSAFAHRRCLIPANGWYEWRRSETGKQPFFITLKDADPDAVLFFAGLWEDRSEGEGSCCAILTEPASPALAFIHDRQPVVLDPACRWQWLDPELQERDAIRAATRRLDPQRLMAFPVSTRVNRPENDDVSLLEPLT